MYTPRQRLKRFLRLLLVCAAVGLFLLVAAFPYLEVCKQRSAVRRHARSLERLLERRSNLAEELFQLAKEHLPPDAVSLALNRPPRPLSKGGVKDADYRLIAREHSDFLVTLLSEVESLDAPAVENLATELAWQTLQSDRRFRRRREEEKRLAHALYDARDAYNHSHANLQTALSAYALSPLGRLFPLGPEKNPYPPLPPLQAPVLDFANILTDSQRSFARHAGLQLRQPVLLMTLECLPHRTTREIFLHETMRNWQYGSIDAPPPIVVLMTKSPESVSLAYPPALLGTLSPYECNIRRVGTRALCLERFDEALPFIYRELGRALSGYPPSDVARLNLHQIYERELARFLSDVLWPPSRIAPLLLPLSLRKYTTLHEKRFP